MDQGKDYKNSPDYQEGLKVFLSKYDPKHMDVIDMLYELSPALADTLVSHVFCDIWSRKTSLLSMREKEWLALSSLITRGIASSEIKAHVYNLLKLGTTRAEIAEALNLMTVYAGVPHVVMASQYALEAMSDFDHSS